MTTTETFAERHVRLCNDARAANGLPPLTKAQAERLLNSIDKLRRVMSNDATLAAAVRATFLVPALADCPIDHLPAVLPESLGGEEEE